MERPEDVEDLPPHVVRTKGSCSDHNSCLISQRQKATKEASRPLRKCRTCGDMVHHDSRTCPEKNSDLARRKHGRSVTARGNVDSLFYFLILYYFIS